MVRKLLIATALAVIRFDSAYQTAAVSTLLIASMGVHFIARPFENHVENAVEFASLLVLQLTYSIVRGERGSTDENGDQIAALDAVLLVVNGLMLLTFIVALLQPILLRAYRFVRQRMGSSMSSSSPSSWWW